MSVCRLVAYGLLGVDIAMFVDAFVMDLVCSGSVPPFFFFHASAIFQFSRRSSDLAVVWCNVRGI